MISVCQVVLTATQMRAKCLVDQSQQGAHEVVFSIPSSDLYGTETVQVTPLRRTLPSSL